MDTIRNYLEGMFAGLPSSSEIMRAKDELLTMMEDKYRELIASGQTENAAVGQVISEFGNLQELAEALGISGMIGQKDYLEVISAETAKKMFNTYHSAYEKIAWGVLIIMLGASIFLLLSGLGELNLWSMSEDSLIGIGIFILITMVAFAVYLFIMGSAPMKEYEHLEKSEFHLDTLAQKLVDSKVKENANVYNSTIALSVILFILSALPLIVSALFENNIPLYLSAAVMAGFIFILKQVKLLGIYVPAMAIILYLATIIGYHPMFGLVTTILMVSLGVYSLIETSSIHTVSNILLQKEEYSVEKKNDSFTEAVSGIYWVLVTAVYLAWSFITNNWQFTWIIWPIAGLLFAAVSILLDYQSKRRS